VAAVNPRDFGRKSARLGVQFGLDLNAKWTVVEQRGQAAAPDLILQAVLPYELIEFPGLRRDVEHSPAVVEAAAASGLPTCSDLHHASTKLMFNFSSSASSMPFNCTRCYCGKRLICSLLVWGLKMASGRARASAAVLGQMQYQQFLQRGAQELQASGQHVRPLLRFGVAGTEKELALNAPSGILVHCFIECCPDEVFLAAHAASV
jgi:hypothetical protein